MANYCKECGAEISLNAQACPKCGAPQNQGFLQAVVKSYNKHIFVWIGSFLCGGFGVDRFMRGQIGTGIAKILTIIPTCGIWVLVDWIIALSKAYGNSFSDSEDITFVNGKYAK